MKRNLLDRQGFTAEDGRYGGSSVQELRDALFENPYCETWPGVGEFQWPRYKVTFPSVLRGILPGGRAYGFLQAARRTVDSRADLRWGPDGMGVRRLLHPNGICVLGTWCIDTETRYTGYFATGSKGRLVGRYSTCCTESSSGNSRSLSLVGKVFPTQDANDDRKMVPASFITQEDIGGTISESIKDVRLLNAPDTTFYRRGLGVPVLLLTGLTFLVSDREPTFRQLYEIAELDKPHDKATISPRFMRLTIERLPKPINQSSLDFRDEIMAQLYDPNNGIAQRTLKFDIEVSDAEGKVTGPMLWQRRKVDGWKRIGYIEIDEAVASYNGDFVIHFHHPAWRENQNLAETAIRQDGRRRRI